MVHLRNILNSMFHDMVVGHVGGDRYLYLSSDFFVFGHGFLVRDVLDPRLPLDWRLSNHVGLHRGLGRVGGLMSVALLIGVLLSLS